MARVPGRPGSGFTPGGSGTPRGRRGWISYFRGVGEELRKVIWPTWSELRRMTLVVVATVIVFGLLIGGADFGFGALATPIITGGPPSPTATPAPTGTPVSTATPSPSASASASPSASASASPSASASATATPSG